jgi:hypothetical protein
MAVADHQQIPGRGKALVVLCCRCPHGIAVVSAELREPSESAHAQG